jgi:AcrR family transcriptional regulator
MTIDTAEPGLRERKRLATRRAIQHAAISLAEQGLERVTVDEISRIADISPRTFFNYFPSKEDAVLGINESEDLAHFAEEFLARGSSGWDAVVDDFIEIVGSHANSIGLSASEHLEFMAILDREPKLLARFIGLGRERELNLTMLVATREGVLMGDENARACIEVVSAIMRSTADRLSDPTVAEDFAAALHDTLSAFRAVLRTPTA